MQKREKISPSRSSAVTSPCAAQVLGQQLEQRLRGIEMIGRPPQVPACLVEGRKLSRTREERILEAVRHAGDAQHFPFEQRNAFTAQRA